MDYCDVFIRCLDSHSDGTHSLQRIHWRSSNIMLNFLKSVLIRRQNHLHLGCPEGEQIFNFSFSASASFLLGCLSFLFYAVINV